MARSTPADESWSLCPECQSLFPKRIWTHGYEDYEHVCDKTKTACSECGIKHDLYSSDTTGLSPCLRALLSRIQTLEAKLESAETLYTALRVMDP